MENAAHANGPPGGPGGPSGESPGEPGPQQRAQSVFVYAKQRGFLSSTAWCRGFVGGRGTGKTTVASLAVLLEARDKEPWMGVAPSFKSLNDGAWPAFLATAEQLGVLVKAKLSPLPRVTFRTRDGGLADITFRTGEEPDSLRGPSKAGLWLDEPSVMHATVWQLGVAVLRHKGRMGRALLTFTPKGRRHWTYGVFCRREADRDVPQQGTELFRAHSSENPFLPPQYVPTVRRQYTAALAAQELAGEFVDLEGLLFRRSSFGEPLDATPRDADRVRYWDLAATPGGGSYSVGCLMGRRRSDGLYFVEHVTRGQWSAEERNAQMRHWAAQDAERWGNRVFLYFEQQPGAAGKEQAQLIVRMLAKYPVRADVLTRGRRERTVAGEKFPGEAKIVRAQPLAAQVEAQNVRLVRGQGRWAWDHDDYLDELLAFPDSSVADQVDASSGAYNKLAMLFEARGTIAASRADVGEPEAKRYGVQIGDRAGTPGWFTRN